jgi:DNA-binding response OmpR family regulator
LSEALVILCVDDEPIGLAARQVLLSVAGYTVLTALRGGNALKLFRYNRVDLVIITGPVLDPNRANLVSEMKRLKPEVPIALLTDLMAPSSEPRQTDLLLTKGITPSEFLAEIAKLLAREGPVEPRKVDQ